MSNIYKSPPSPWASTSSNQQNPGVTSTGNAQTAKKPELTAKELNDLFALGKTVDSTSQWLNLIMDVFEKSKNRDLEKDKAELDRRIEDGLQQRHLGLLLMLSGKDDGKVYMAANESINSARQLSSMIDSNPEGYKVHSAYKLVFGENAGQGAISQMMTLMQYGAGYNQYPKQSSGTGGTSKEDVWNDLVSAKDKLIREQVPPAQRQIAHIYVDRNVKSTMGVADYMKVVRMAIDIANGKGTK